MRAAVIIGVITLAAVTGFIAILYRVGKEMNQYRTCSHGFSR